MGKTIKKNAKAKKSAVKAKIAERKAKLKAKFAALVALLCVGLMGGCALERADPAARSNRATYTIGVGAEGGSTATAYISDGLMATADGEGAITQPATLTTGRDGSRRRGHGRHPGDRARHGQGHRRVLGEGIGREGKESVRVG